MKVLLVITRLVVGGAARQLLIDAAGLKDSGCQVLVASGPPEPGLADLRPAFAAAGIAVRTIAHLGREIQPRRDLLALFELLELIRRFRPRVLHSHTSKAGFLARLAGALEGVPLRLHSPHGLVFAAGAEIPGVPAHGLGRWALVWAERLGGRLARRVLTLSAQEARAMADLGLVPPRRLSVLPNAVGPEFLRQKPRRPASGERPRLLVAARLAAEKGLDLLLEAMDRGDDFELSIAGDGPQRGELEQLAHRRGLEVHFLGVVEHMPRLMAAHDLLVLPSRYEGYGMVLAEAMALGLPVLATAVGGVPEVLGGGQRGALAPPSVEGLRAGLAEFRRDPEAFAQRARHARAWALKHLHPETKLQRLLAVYRQEA